MLQDDEMVVPPVDDDDLRQAIGDLFAWAHRNPPSRDGFYSKLYTAMQSADAMNMRRFRRGFPSETEAFSRWRECDSEERFFKAWGFR